LREEIGEERLVMGYIAGGVYVVSLAYLGWRVKTCGWRNDAREKES
jgi:hypothetical protein